MLVIWGHLIVSVGCNYPDSKAHVANMGPTWVVSAPGGPHVSPVNLTQCTGIDTNIEVITSSRATWKSQHYPRLRAATTIEWGHQFLLYHHETNGIWTNDVKINTQNINKTVLLIAWLHVQSLPLYHGVSCPDSLSLVIYVFRIYAYKVNNVLSPLNNH